VKWFKHRFVYACYESDPKCYNPRVLKSLCHEKRQRSEAAKQFFRSSVATHFNSRVTAQGQDAEQNSVGDLQECNGDHDNHHQRHHQLQQQE